VLKTAVLYLRVSTQLQEREGASLDAQEEECRRYAAGRNLRVVAVVREQVSGRKETLQRPGLLEALDYLDQGQATHLVVWSLDRFARNVHSATDLIYRYFGEGRDYDLLVATEEIDTRTAGGRMLLHVKLAVAQYEAERTSERIRSVKKFLREEGCFQGGLVPYGYRIGRVTKRGARKLVLHRREQAILRLARKLAFAGLSLRQSAAVMEDRGVTNRKGRRFDPRQIKRMLDATLQEQPQHGTA
jgi:site-specific DNA recombinase